MRLYCRALRFAVMAKESESTSMLIDAKNITYGETAIDRLVQLLRASGQPQDLTKLTERYIELLREMVQTDEQRSSAS